MVECYLFNVVVLVVLFLDSSTCHLEERNLLSRAVLLPFLVLRRF